MLPVASQCVHVFAGPSVAAGPVLSCPVVRSAAALVSLRRGADVPGTERTMAGVAAHRPGEGDKCCCLTVTVKTEHVFYSCTSVTVLFSFFVF